MYDPSEEGFPMPLPRLPNWVIPQADVGLWDDPELHALCGAESSVTGSGADISPI